MDGLRNVKTKCIHKLKSEQPAQVHEANSNTMFHSPRSSRKIDKTMESCANLLLDFVPRTNFLLSNGCEYKKIVLSVKSKLHLDMYSSTHIETPADIFRMMSI